MTKKEQVIDFGGLETYLKRIETALEPLNLVEKDLVLAQAISRLRDKVNKAKRDDILNDISWGGIMKRVMKQTGGDPYGTN